MGQLLPTLAFCALTTHACCSPTADRIRAFTETLTSAVGTAGVLGSGEAARYWAYHLTRSGFFMAQVGASCVGERGGGVVLVLAGQAWGRAGLWQGSWGGGAPPPWLPHSCEAAAPGRLFPTPAHPRPPPACPVVQGLAALLASRAAAGRDGDSPALTRFENMFRRGWSGPLTEALLMFYQVGPPPWGCRGVWRRQGRPRRSTCKS